MSLFEKDLAKEAILGIFLSDQYSSNDLKTKRITDKGLQLKGVDLIIETNDGLNFKIDEKAQLHYINKDLPTFALEIDYLKDGVLKEGWLYSSEKITEIYAFVFSIHLIDGSNELEKEEDIRSCEVVFVNRIRLINKLATLNLDLKTCKAVSNVLRSAEEETKINHPSGFNFQISNHLTEKPVNLVVKKSFLESLGKKFSFSR